MKKYWAFALCSRAVLLLRFHCRREIGMIEIIPWEEGVFEEKDKKSHIAIEVADFEAAVEHLRNAGVTVEEPGTSSPTAGGFFRDITTNNVLHLVYRPEAVWAWISRGVTHG